MSSKKKKQNTRAIGVMEYGHDGVMGKNNIGIELIARLSSI
jgi:hypothetical protein